MTYLTIEKITMHQHLSAFNVKYKSISLATYTTTSAYRISSNYKIYLIVHYIRCDIPVLDTNTYAELYSSLHR